MTKMTKQDIKELLIICLIFFAIFLVLSAAVVFALYVTDSSGKSGWQLEDSINSHTSTFMFCVFIGAVMTIVGFISLIVLEKLGYKSETYYLDSIATDVSKIAENIENENIRQTKEEEN